jgi:hypothetical protein
MEIDNLNRLVGSGISIYSSRERIRRQLVDFAQSYLELETVDFYKTSVLSYLIDTISILTANHLFYDSMIYREFFFVDAQLKDSVYNLAKWIGYEIPKAVASTVDIMFTIPLTFSSPDVFFTVPNNFMAYAEDIPFRVDSRSINVPSARFNYNKTKFLEDVTARGIIINNSALSIRDSDGFYRPIFVNENENGLIFASFTLPFTQHERIIEQFHIPETIQPYQFFSKKIKFEGMVSGVRVWVIEPGIGEKIPLDITNPDDFDQYEMKQSYISGRDGNMYRWTEWKESSNGIYTLSSNSQQFIFVGGINQCEILFGNGIVGRQPIRNSAVTVELFITKGEEGHIIPNSITKSDELKYSILARQDEDGMTPSTVTSRQHSLNFQITNPIHSQGGVNTPTLPEIKRNAIVNLRSKGKLVSDSDYDDINIIMGPSFPTVQAYPILKRSDIKTNEIMAFILLQYYDEEYLPQIVPTRNSKIYLDDPSFNDKNEFTIMRTSKILIDNERYETLFNITLNKNNRQAKYDYVLQNVKGSPSILYNEDVPSFYQQYAYIPIKGIDFNVQIDNSSHNTLSVYDSTNNYPLKIRVNVNHIPQDLDSDYYIEDFRCRLVTKWGSNKIYSQAACYPENPNFSEGEGYQWFEFEIPNYLEVPPEIQRYEFYIDINALRRDIDGNFIDENGNIITNSDVITNNPEQFTAWQPLIRYYCDIMVRKDLSEVMSSSITKQLISENSNAYRYCVHNVPVVLSRYLDDGDGGGIYNRSDNSTFPNFESSVMQPLISNLKLTDKRMLTDFINIKFPDTYGPLTNLKFNPVDHIVNSRFRTPFNWENPTNIKWNPNIHPENESTEHNLEYSTGTKFIVNGPVSNYESAGKSLSSYVNYIAEYYENSGWYLMKPNKGLYVKVKDELDFDNEEQIIVYDGDKWISITDSFKIPLLIDLKIEIDKNSTTSSNELKSIIKEQIIEHFSPYMGIHRELDRSEISAVVRKVPGVVYCEVKKPEVDIRFKYDIRDLTQKQLIDYTPQYTGVVSNYRNYSADSQDDGIQIEIIK